MKKDYKKFPFTIGELPTSFLMSMTYEEQLLWLSNYIQNTVIPLLKENQEAIEKLNELTEKLDQKIIEIDEALAELDNFKEEIRQEVASELTLQYNRVITLMNDYQTIFNQDLNNLNNELGERIDNIELGAVVAYNPTTGTYENVSKVIQDVYDSLRNNSITASEFDALELTASVYDEKQISAYNFDVNGRTFLLS